MRMLDRDAFREAFKKRLGQQLIMTGILAVLSAVTVRSIPIWILAVVAVGFLLLSTVALLVSVSRRIIASNVSDFRPRASSLPCTSSETRIHFHIRFAPIPNHPIPLINSPNKCTNDTFDTRKEILQTREDTSI